MLYSKQQVRDNLRNREGKPVFYLGKGDFILLDEEDLHRPCISVNGATPVKKYVFKIKKA